MKSSSPQPQIPIDLYESPKELLIIMPLGGVQKKSVEMYFDDYKLVLSGTRVQPQIKDDLIPLKQDCYRGKFTHIIDLPANIYFDRIHSKITEENILMIIIPKQITPEKIKLEIAY